MCIRLILQNSDYEHHLYPFENLMRIVKTEKIRKHNNNIRNVINSDNKYCKIYRQKRNTYFI